MLLVFTAPHQTYQLEPLEWEQYSLLSVYSDVMKRIAYLHYQWNYAYVCLQHKRELLALDKQPRERTSACATHCHPNVLGHNLVECCHGLSGVPREMHG